MQRKQVLATLGLIVLALSLPFVILHWVAAPDDARISVFQRAVAALSNYAGPWGVVLVRLADFPNAGMRSFNPGLAAAMTFFGAAVIFGALKTRKRTWQTLLFVLWGIFVLAWFSIGLLQIADGLL